MSIRRAPILMLAILAVACGGPGPSPTSTPSAATPSAAVPSAAPSTAPTSSPAPSPAATTPAASQPVPSAPPSPGVTTPIPGSSLDPSLSDAGIVGRVTLTNDTRFNRDGTHEIVGVADDGSDCSFTFEGDEFIAVAWYDDAPDGLIHQMGVSVPTDEMPVNDGEQRLGIDDGRVSFDFVSETGFGTLYTADASEQGGGNVTLDIAVRGEQLVFDFEGVTSNGADFSGQLICVGANLS